MNYETTNSSSLNRWNNGTWARLAAGSSWIPTQTDWTYYAAPPLVLEAPPEPRSPYVPRIQRVAGFGAPRQQFAPPRLAAVRPRTEPPWVNRQQRCIRRQVT